MKADEALVKIYDLLFFNILTEIESGCVETLNPIAHCSFENLPLWIIKSNAVL